MRMIAIAALTAGLMTSGVGVASAQTAAPSMNVPDGYTVAAPGAVTGSQMKGVNIYDTTGANVAEISDVELGAGGMVTAIITDVGGFLGIGAKRVALTPEQIIIYKNANGDMRAYVTATKEQLKALPEYKEPKQ